jgi:hypothetical protein
MLRASQIQGDGFVVSEVQAKLQLILLAQLAH